MIGNKKIRCYLDPKDYGFDYCSLSDIQGGNAILNRQLIMNAFEGKENAISDTITFNAVVVFHLTGKTASIKEDVDLSYYSIKNGIVLDYLEKLRAADHKWLFKSYP